MGEAKRRAEEEERLRVIPMEEAEEKLRKLAEKEDK